MYKTANIGERKILLQGKSVGDYPDVALEQQSESVPMFTREELIIEHHAIVTSVQMIENVGDGDSLIVLQDSKSLPLLRKGLLLLKDL
uniref:Uncharacterized protein n=1 Tax=Tanacetum cinerariifolium TaxID=118510 RepID=A0A699IPP6_TANCI|nr:hypothetical protein [Tanacetum cinerariifolium]